MDAAKEAGEKRRSAEDTERDTDSDTGGDSDTDGPASDR